VITSTATKADPIPSMRAIVLSANWLIMRKS